MSQKFIYLAFIISTILIIAFIEYLTNGMAFHFFFG